MDLFYLEGNWIDFIVLIILGLYIVEEWKKGFIQGVIELVGIAISILFALKFYFQAGSLLIANFSLPRGIANTLGFILIAFFAEFLALLFIHLTYKLIPNKKINQKLNLTLGFIPAFISGLLLAAFLLTILLTLPIRPNIKKDVADSKIGGYLTQKTTNLERTFSDIFGRAANETLTFLTIKPDSKELVNLHFKTNDIDIDSVSENKMLNLLNSERNSQGLALLIQDEMLQSLARSHCEDMFRRGYFSHYTPDGLSPFARMKNFGINYDSAGENLAFAPTLEIAHKGLMESIGHRENILSKNFGRVGIGVIDAGIYGKMFCQEFTN